MSLLAAQGKTCVSPVAALGHFAPKHNEVTTFRVCLQHRVLSRAPVTLDVKVASPEPAPYTSSGAPAPVHVMIALPDGAAAAPVLIAVVDATAARSSSRTYSRAAAGDGNPQTKASGDQSMGLPSNRQRLAP